MEKKTIAESASRAQGAEGSGDAIVRVPVAGLLATVSAFAIWGVSPLFWRCLSGVPAIEIALHRVVWSWLFLAPFLLSRRSREDLWAALTDRSRLGVLAVTSVLVAANWTIYIWAVTHDRVLHASLGYYINPLVNVALGVVILGERLRPAQRLAVVLAAAAVSILALRLGSVPWVALGLAGTFGLYALFRKQAAVGPRTGLTVETMLLGVPGAAVLVVLLVQGRGVFLQGNGLRDVLLVLSGPITAVPLLLFNVGAKRLRLATVGLTQYVAPTLMFLLAVTLFDEPFSRLHGVVFGLIWCGLALYTLDTYRGRRARAAAGN